MNALKYRHLLALALFVSLSAFTSCVSEDERQIVKNDTERVVKVRLNLPAMQELKTRAMSYEDENRLLEDMLTILTVKNGVVAKAYLTGSIVYDPDDRSKAMITVKIPESENDIVKLCVIANHTIVGATDNFDDFRQAQIYDIYGEWDTSQSIPMWGESDEIIVNDPGAIYVVDMYRALARVDVGLNFIVEDGKLTESAEGLADFEMNSISVHNTNNQMYIAPTSFPPVTPNVPNNDDRRYGNPLIYDASGVNAYVREIYIPESGLPDPFAIENVHCMVVGGFYGGSANETFYRLEFARKNTDNVSYLPVLRNHRYVFNIVEIKGVGYSSREEAFNNNGTVAENVIVYDLVVLDESIHRVEFKNGYFFGLDNRLLTLEPLSGNIGTIKYQTNLPITEGLAFEWADPATGMARYRLGHDEGDDFFTVETLTENGTDDIYTDLLYVKSGPFTIPVTVRQKRIDRRFSINSGSIMVLGTYIMGEPLNNTHKITLTITAADASLQGQQFRLETEELNGDHGISFSATGTFDFSGIAPGDPLVMTIVLQGSGTLSMSAGSDPFKLRINTNSILGDYSEVTIVPVNPIMNIAVLASRTNTYGYSIQRLEGGAGQVFNNTNNFGPYDHSIVKASGFNYINSSYNFGIYPNQNLYKWITGIGNGGKIADMVYIAYPASFGSTSGQLLAEYLRNGGVIVAFLEGTSSVLALMNNVFDNNVETDRSPNTFIVPMPANRALVPDDEEYKSVMRQFEGDWILNGPFGDVRDKQIGEDASTFNGLLNLPEDQVTIYAYANNLNASPYKTNSNLVVGFKIEEDGADGRNMFFWGDGGLMSSELGRPYDGGTTVCPFWWDTTTFFPVPRPEYGLSSRPQMPVYNSTIFCNIMAWGIKRSNELKGRRLEFEQNFVNP